MSKPESALQAPIQTREDTLSRPERLIPLIIAEHLNRLTEYSTGMPIPRVDIWNTVGQKMDDQFSSQTTYATREAYSLAMISKRYEILELLFGIPRSGRIAVSDASSTYEEVVKDEINKNLISGRFRIDTADFHFCNQCQRIIALKEAPLTRCTCGNPNLGVLTCKAMFMQMSQEDKSVISTRLQTIGNKRSKDDFNQRLASVPERILISKPRSHGFKLDYLGLNMVLDPRVALSYFPLVVDKSTEVKVATIVQGVDTSMNTIPFTSLLVDTINPRYLLINKLGDFQPDQDGQFKIFYGHFLPLMLAGSSTNIEEGQIEVLRKEYSKTITKLNNVLKVLGQEHNMGGECQFTVEETEMLEQSLRSMAQADYRKAALTLRNFLFEVMSKKYINIYKDQGLGLNSKSLDQFTDQFKLIYG